jgi:hypothetical protein
MGAGGSRTTAAATYTIPSGDGLRRVENEQNNLCCDANKALTEDYKTLQGILASTKKSLEENLAATKKSLAECLAKEQFVQAQLLEPNTDELTLAGGGKRRRRRTAKKRLSRRRKSHRRP